MKINLHLFSILIVSFIFSQEAKLSIKSSKFIDDEINNSNVYLTIESDEDIYGIQFDIKYNSNEIKLTEDAIVSKILDIKKYSSIKEDGIARVLLIGLSGEKIVDVTKSKISDLIDINFQPEGDFRGTSVIELLDIMLAGAAGIEVGLNISSTHSYEISFIIPEYTYLSKNYPEPFNSITNINFALSEAGMVSLVIYDLQGSLIKTLFDGYKEKNYHNVYWDGVNDSGEGVGSGKYILKMSTPKFLDTITITLLK